MATNSQIPRTAAAMNPAMPMMETPRIMGGIRELSTIAETQDQGGNDNGKGYPIGCLVLGHHQPLQALNAYRDFDFSLLDLGDDAACIPGQGLKQGEGIPGNA